MEQIGVFQAKTHLSELLVAVSEGKEFTITRHGEKIALLVPFTGIEKGGSVKGAIRGIKKLRKKTTLGKRFQIKKLQSEGRK